MLMELCSLASFVTTYMVRFSPFYYLPALSDHS